jgi:hypothetical protein
MLTSQTGILPPPLPENHRYIKVRKDVAGFLFGDRWVTPADAPFPCDAHRAADLVAKKMADYVDRVDPIAAIPPPERSENPPAVEHAVDPAPAKAERPTHKR